MEKSADDVDIFLCTSSSSLDKPRAERILNKNLKKDIPPPWGSNTADYWRNRLEKNNISTCFCLVVLFFVLFFDEEALAIFNVFNILSTTTI